MVEILLVSALVLSVSVMYFHSSKFKHPQFTTVKTFEKSEMTAHQRYLFEEFSKNGFYVTYSLLLPSGKVPIALEPYKIALLDKEEYTKFLFLKILKLRLSGWKVVLFSSDQTETELRSLVHKLMLPIKPAASEIEQVQ